MRGEGIVIWDSSDKKTAMSEYATDYCREGVKNIWLNDTEPGRCNI